MAGDEVRVHVILMKLTPEGAKDPVAALAALDKIRTAAVDPLGLKNEQSYALMGEYDFISIFENADSDIAAFYSLELAKTGFVTTQTHYGFPSDTFCRVIPKGGPTRNYIRPEI
jgi:uncharacterized protein with GYD domain